MGLESCEICGLLFQKVRSSICPRCVEKLEEDMKKVRRFLRVNPNKTVEEIAEATEVEEEIIIRFIQEGNIQVAKPPESVKRNCVGCGVPIMNGERCPKCQQKLLEQLKSTGDLAKSREYKPDESDDEIRKGFRSRLKS